jgi:hypothetical protein
MSEELPQEGAMEASLTINQSPSGNPAIRARLEKAASYLRDLPEGPREAALVYQPPNAPAPVAMPIGEGLTIGRGEGCEIRMPERQELSRQHFTVRRLSDGKFVAEDLGSFNGTRMDGLAPPLTKRELQDGDLLLAGGLVFLFTNPR